MNYILRPILTIVTYGSTAILIILLLAINNPFLTFFSFGTLSFLYVSIYVWSKNKFHFFGLQQSNLNKKRYQIIESLYEKFEKISSTNRGILVENLYDKTGQHLAKINSLNTIFASMPKYVLEILIIGSILVFVIIQNTTNYNYSNSTIAIFAIGAVKLLPLMQGIFQAMANLKFGNGLLTGYPN